MIVPIPMKVLQKGVAAAAFALSALRRLSALQAALFSRSNGESASS